MARARAGSNRSKNRSRGYVVPRCRGGAQRYGVGAYLELDFGRTCATEGWMAEDRNVWGYVLHDG